MSDRPRHELIPPAQRFDWRAHLKVHPAVDLFPPLSEDELGALAADIKANGLQTRAVIYQDGDDAPQLLDGRNRLDALAALGWLRLPEGRRPREKAEEYADRIRRTPVVFVDPVHEGDHEKSPFTYCFGADPYAAALSLNVHRRRLNAEQRRELIAKVLKARPEQSNRAIAKQVDAADKTVGKVRAELESTAAIPQLEKTVGTDGKARKVPAKKPKQPASRSQRVAMAAQKQAEDVAAKLPQSWTSATEERQTVDVLEIIARAYSDVGRVRELLQAGAVDDRAVDMIRSTAVAWQDLLNETTKSLAAPDANGNGVDVDTSAEAMKVKFAEEPAPPEPPKRKRGRPPGSKNKPTASSSVPPTEAPIADAPDDGGVSASTMGTCK